MARFTSGWTPSHRSSTSDSDDNPYFGDGLLLALRVILINWAARRPTQIRTNCGDLRTVARGDIVTSHAQLARQLGCTVDMVRCRLSRALDPETGFLTSMKPSRGLHLRIKDYDVICVHDPDDPSISPSIGPASAQHRPNVLDKGNKKTNKQAGPAGGYVFKPL